MGISAVANAASVDTLSRFALSSTALLDQRLIQDPIAHFRQTPKRRLYRVALRLLEPIWFFVLLLASWQPRVPRWLLPKHYLDTIELCSVYDQVVQVGGSFFVDLYGFRQFEHILCCNAARVRISLAGHSLGPYEGSISRMVARYAFSRCKDIYLREGVSEELLRQLIVEPGPDISVMPDTAWLMNYGNPVRNSRAAPVPENGRKTIAVTFRELAPFEARLGITQSEYEAGFAKELDSLIDSGYRIIALSTCTSFGGYHKDDRMVALRIQKIISEAQHFHVVLDELNDIELGKVIETCEITVGTRLHSSLISLAYGTPTVNLAYEHKSTGIFQGLGLGEFCMQPADLVVDGRLFGICNKLLSDIAFFRNCIADMKVREQSACITNLRELLKQ